MTNGMLTASSPRWAAIDRLVLVVVLASFALPPGLGLDTRSLTTNDALRAVLAVVFLGPPIGALLASWRWPLMAARLSVLAGLLVIAYALLDLFGVMAGPPPTGMVLFDAWMALVGAALVWRSWRLARV